MTSYFRFVLRHRRLVLALCLLLSGAALVSLAEAVVASNVIKLFLGESPDYARYVQRIEQFTTDELFVVALEEADPFEPRTLSRLEAAVRAIEALPDVTAVRGPLSAMRIRGEDDTLFVEPYGELARAAPQGRAGLLEQLRSDPMVRGLLVSDDARHVAFVVEIAHDADRPAEAVPGLVAHALEAFHRQGFEPRRVHRAGMPAVFAAIVDESYRNLLRLFPLSTLALLGAVFLMFHRVWPVVVTGTVAFVAVLWTMGVAVLFDRNVNILMAAVPAVVFVVSFSDVVHLCSSYLLELERGCSKDEAILRSASDVGLACFLTSATTFVGFVSLALIPTPAFRQLGLALGLGVALALLLAMTLVPLLFWAMPVPRPWRSGSSGRLLAALDTVLDVSQRVSVRHPRAIFLVALAVTAVCLVGLGRLRIETDMAQRLEASSSIRRDTAYFREHFHGTSTLELFLDADAPDAFLDPELFAAVASYQAELERLPHVDSVLSLVDLVELLHRELHDGRPERPLPATRAALAQYLLLFESAGGRDLEHLVDFQRSTLRLALRLDTEAARATAAVGLEAERLARETFGPRVHAEASGIFYLVGRWLDHIVLGQKRGILVSVLLTTVMMVLGLASLRVGLWSMVPNVLPVLCLGGWLGLTWEQVDSDVLMVAILAIGISVDDTIHFLTRFRLESQRTASVAEALEATFHFSGRAIVLTTVILVLGFAPFVLSSYLSLHVMGTLLPMVLIVALLADLFLLPALIRTGWIRF